MENNLNQINTQDLKTLKAYLKDYLNNFADYWKPTKEGKILCRNPHHQEHNPSMSFNKKNNTLHCFSCGVTYSLIDLIILDYAIGQEQENETEEELKARLKDPKNIATACNKIRELFNLGAYQGTPGTTPQPTKAPEPQEEKPDPIIEATTSIVNNWEMLQANNNKLGVTHYNYLEARGINRELIDALKIYSLDQEQKLFIPYNLKGTCEHVTERTLNAETPKELRYKHHGKTRPYDPFNYLMANCSRVIFITEGEIDAISLYTCFKEIKAEQDLKINYGAVAIGGTNGKRALMDTIANIKDKTNLYFVICLDNDKPGQQASHELKIMMHQENLFFTDRSPLAEAEEPIKDFNDQLRANKELLKVRLVNTITNIKDLCEATKQDILKAIEEELKKAREEFINTRSALNCLPSFIASLGKDKTIKTNIYKLDQALNGGLREGIFTIGAPTSLGKTTLIHQIADQLAQSQKDILYISLEMAKTDLIAKSLSRLMYLLAPNSTQLGRGQQKATEYLLSYSEILEQRFNNNYRKQQEELLGEALEAYKSFANHFYYTDYTDFKGISLSVAEIREQAQEIKKNTNQSPIIIIDYLQLLGSPEPNKNLTDKQIIDQNILMLTSLAHELKTTILLISSINRASYSLDVDLQSFKESGAIEYSSEAIIGLNWYLNEDEREEFKEIKKKSKDLPDNEKQKDVNDFYKKIKAKDPRHIKADILKNRKGAFNQSIELYFFPKYNLFVDNQNGSTDDLKELLDYSRDTREDKGEFIPLPF